MSKLNFDVEKQLEVTAHGGEEWVFTPRRVPMGKAREEHDQRHRDLKAEYEDVLEGDRIDGDSLRACEYMSRTILLEVKEQYDLEKLMEAFSIEEADAIARGIQDLRKRTDREKKSR